MLQCSIKRSKASNGGIMSSSANPTSAYDMTGAASLFARSIEPVIEMQKMMLDFAEAHATGTVEAFKTGFPAMKTQAAMLDIAAQVFEQCVDTQKKVLDLWLQQSAAMTEAPSAGAPLSKNMSAAMEVLQQSAMRSVSAQKAALSLVSKQNNAVGDAVRKYLSGTPAEAAVEAVQRSMEVVLEAETEFLDIASNQFKQTGNA